MKMPTEKSDTSEASLPTEQGEPDLDDEYLAKFIDERCPTKVYDEARTTIVYRLSEAMFASLLAAYIIGFANFLGPVWRANEESLSVVAERTTELSQASAESAPPASPPQRSIKDQIIDGLIFIGPLTRPLCVSLVFSFATAATYLIYNMSILTMPSYDGRRGSRDFAFAVSQGILFGIAITYPPFLLFATGLLFLLSLCIKYHELLSLVNYLEDTVVYRRPKSRRVRAVMEHRMGKAMRMKKAIQHYFPEWGLPLPRFFWGSLAIVLAGAGVAFTPSLPTDHWLEVVTALNAILAAGVILVSFRTIRNSATFLKPADTEDERSERTVDERFNDLVRELSSMK